MLSWLRAVLSVDQPSTAYGLPERVALVREVLDELAPGLALDGGRIELLGVDDDGRVEVRMMDACARCHSRSATLEGVLVPRLRARAPWFTAVVTASER